MDEEREIIKENLNLKNNNNDPSYKYCNNKKKIVFKFSLRLLFIRIMLFSIFYIFCYYMFKLIKNIPSLEDSIYKSNQLIKSNNIQEIGFLNVSINIEHSKYVHLKITDRNNMRWEVPNEILNSDYFSQNNSPKDNNSIFRMETQSPGFSFFLYLDENNNNNNTNATLDKKIFYSFNTSKNFLFSNNYITFESELTTDNIYGFGERIHKFKLDEGIYTIWPTDQENIYDDGKGGKNLYGHQPIGLHKTKYKDLWLGFVFLNTNAQDLRIHKKDDNTTTLTHITIGGIIDYYIIVDNSPENVLKDIHYLIGKPALPPFWSLGIHQSRRGYNNSNEFKNVYETYKAKKIPIDAMWLDIDGMYNYEIFTLNQNKFGELPKYVDEVIHKDYGYFVPILDMGISYNKDNLNKYAKIGDENNLFIKSGYTQKNLMGYSLAGITVFPDFFNPDVYKLWDTGLDDYYNIIKFDGIWLDMNEPSNIKKSGKCPGETFGRDKYCNVMKDLKISYLPGYTHNLNHLTTGTINLNGITYNNQILYNNKPLINIYQACYTFLNLKYKNKRPFVLSRANTIGSGKFLFHWLGENFSQNKYIEYSISGIFNYNIFGMPFTGADICGFNGNANDKLCARWYNIGAFYPFSRNHNSKGSIEQYPWSFGENIEKIIKRDIQYRYSLLRYYYSQLFLITLNERGSFFKPVMFEFPNDIYSYEDIESKIMIGESILICAFFDNDEKDKEFIFPNSNFNIYPSGETFLNYSIDNSISLRKKKLSGKISDLHIFVRGGSIIPFQDIFNKSVLNSYYLRQEKISLIINPDNEGKAKGSLFFDCEEEDVIDNYKYIRMDMEFKNKTLTININKEINDHNYTNKDQNIQKIEIWRIDEILDLNKTKIKDGYTKVKCVLIANYDERLQALIDLKNNKMIIDFSDSERNYIWNHMSLFLINKVYLK